MEIQKGEAAAAEAGVEVRAPSRFMRIGVFCGSSMGKKASYQDAAVELGQELAARNIDLVYGGGSLGLMGLVSQAVYSGGRNVVGVIPMALMPREITGEAMGEVKVVSNMHQRKAEMTRQSDAFIALPGGYGTVEELFEAITWAQLGIHDKPVVKGSYWSCHSSCPKMPLARARYQKAQTVTIGKCYCMPVGVLNVDGYYDALVSSIDTAVEEGFIQPSARHIIVPKELLDKLETYSPRHKEVAPKTKWELDRKVSCAEIPGDEDVVVSAQCGNML